MRGTGKPSLTMGLALASSLLILAPAAAVAQSINIPLPFIGVPHFGPTYHNNYRAPAPSHHSSSGSSGHDFVIFVLLDTGKGRYARGRFVQRRIAPDRFAQYDAADLRPRSVIVFIVGASFIVGVSEPRHQRRTGFRSITLTIA